jgi:S-adenosylmethionine decarboxylase
MSGMEWIIDAEGCSAEALRDAELLRKFFEKIVDDLELHTVGETHWHQFPGSGGITGLCLLSESHLTCHTFPEYGSLCLNLFSCIARPQWDFEKHLIESISATSVDIRRIEREYAFPEVIEAAVEVEETRLK